jgi:diguanylate cyclase (GGDEF)-like protein
MQYDGLVVPGPEFPMRGLVDQMPDGHAACIFPFKGSFGPRGVLVTVQQLGREVEDETVFMWSHIFNELMDHRAVLTDLKNKSEELADAYALLRERSLHDELTGLANRRFFRERLNHVTSSSAGTGSHPYAVLWLDVDSFKNLNDTLGHAAGDAVLVEVANRLRANLRTSDLAARLGGDEFVVLVDASSRQVLDSLVDRLAHALNEPYAVEENTLCVTVSIGVAFGGHEPIGPDDILREADMAMYQAKLTRSGAIVRAGD